MKDKTILIVAAGGGSDHSIWVETRNYEWVSRLIEKIRNHGWQVAMQVSKASAFSEDEPQGAVYVLRCTKQEFPEEATVVEVGDLDVAEILQNKADVIIVSDAVREGWFPAQFFYAGAAIAKRALLISLDTGDLQLTPLQRWPGVVHHLESVRLDLLANEIVAALEPGSNKENQNLSA